MASNTTPASASRVRHGDLFPNERGGLSPWFALPEEAVVDVERLYQTIVLDPKFAHFVHIPERIIHCLDHFGVGCDRMEIEVRLRSYYLFIGVVDDAIDSGQLEIGKQILERLGTRIPSFDEQTRVSCVHLATEVLKRDISDEVYPAVLMKLHELYRAVVKERKARTIAAYIEQREAVGCLTAELSYLLIRPFLKGECQDFCDFMKRVGAVGCLVDSVIDLAVDAELGLLSFQPATGDFLKLVSCTARKGLSLSLKHPALFRLFFEAVSDNVQDRFRTGGGSPRRLISFRRRENVASVV
jgi:hypothetical protein